MKALRPFCAKSDSRKGVKSKLSAMRGRSVGGAADSAFMVAPALVSPGPLREAVFSARNFLET
jgi:hypothetical protein